MLCIDIMGYHSQRDVMFLKITLLLPKLIPSAKRVLEQGIGFAGHETKSYQCYETNIDFDTRFLLKKMLYDFVNHCIVHILGYIDDRK